ncbi:DMT family transporter [Limibacter armeniacum]|uniref:DMT family transporter n=1 Tax=Limibacter armeniacum TaxID=466084 RepID=UPI002FE62726
MLSKGVQYMLLSALVMTTMQTCVKVVSHLPAAEVVFFRASISVVMSYITLRAQKVAIWGKPENRPILWARGVFGTIALVMVFATFQNMPLASALLLHYLAPIFTALLTAIFLKERLYKVQWLFFLMCFAGIFLIKGFDSRVNSLYFMLAVVGALFSAAAYTCIRKLKGNEHPIVIVFYFPFVALPITGLMTIFNWKMPIGDDWIYLLAIGILTQIGQVLLTKAYQAEEAAKVASVNYTGIIYGLAFGFLFFGETYDWMVYIGMALVIVGVLLNVTFKKLFKIGR